MSLSFCFFFYLFYFHYFHTPTQAESEILSSAFMCVWAGVVFIKKKKTTLTDDDVIVVPNDVDAELNSECTGKLGTQVVALFYFLFCFSFCFVFAVLANTIKPPHCVFSCHMWIFAATVFVLFRKSLKAHVHQLRGCCLFYCGCCATNDFIISLSISNGVMDILKVLYTC